MAEPFAVDWRALLNYIGVPWIDKGRNTSRGNVNINCPMCGDDTGYHMRVSEEYEIFNCWRNNKHGGTNFSYLLSRLGCTRIDAVHLLEDYRQSHSAAPAIAAPVQDLGKHWRKFEPLTEAPANHPVVTYFHTRGFEDPYTTALRYDLRYSPVGSWAMRMLLPLQYDGAIRTWTGRSVSPHVEPRYLVKKIEDPSQLYIPAPPRDILYLVEGPIDALKICSAMQGTGTTAVALCSKDLNAGRILRLQGFACKEVRLLLDNDAPLHQQFDMLKTLASSLRCSYVNRWRLPGCYKDAGEVPEKELQTLLR